MMSKVITEIDVALEVITSVADELNIPIESVKQVLIRLSEKGISGAEGGKLLRKTLKELKNE